MRLPLAFVLATLALDAIGIGLILPVLPHLIADVTGAGLADAALWGGILTTAFAVMQFMFGPLLGALSDRFGRKPVLLISLAVMALDYALMAVAPSIWLLLVGRIIAGIAASNYATAAAYIADITPPERRGGSFGLIGAAFGTGFILGPALGGLLGEWGTRAPFVAASLLACANVAFGLIVLRESLPAARRRAFVLRKANPVASFARLGRFRRVGRLLAVYFLYEVAMIVYPATWAYFTALRFGWGPGMIGASLATFGIAFAIVQGGLVRLAIRRWGERGTIARGLSLNAVVLVALSVVSDGRAGLVLAALSASGAVVVPALQALMSARVPADSQGELQGLVGSARAVAMIVGPMLMTTAFFAFTRPGTPIELPGAAFVVALALVAMAGAMLWHALRDEGTSAPIRH